jgi:hypothetical protein
MFPKQSVRYSAGRIRHLLPSRLLLQDLDSLSEAQI